MSVVAGIGFLTGVVMMLVAPGVLAQTSTRFYADPSSASLGGAITVVQSTGVGSLGPNSPGRIVSLIIQCFDEKGDVVASAKGDIAKDAKSGSVKVPSNPAGKTIVRCVVYVGYGSGTDQLDITIKTGGGATPPPKPPTKKSDPDLDGDGIPDFFDDDKDGDKLENADDPSPEDPNGDFDKDGLPDTEEVSSGTDPKKANQKCNAADLKKNPNFCDKDVKDVGTAISCGKDGTVGKETRSSYCKTPPGVCAGKADFTTVFDCRPEGCRISNVDGKVHCNDPKKDEQLQKRVYPKKGASIETGTEEKVASIETGREQWYSIALSSKRTVSDVEASFNFGPGVDVSAISAPAGVNILSTQGGLEFTAGTLLPGQKLSIKVLLSEAPSGVTGVLSGSVAGRKVSQIVMSPQSLTRPLEEPTPRDIIASPVGSFGQKIPERGILPGEGIQPGEGPVSPETTETAPTQPTSPGDDETTPTEPVPPTSPTPPEPPVPKKSPYSAPGDAYKAVVNTLVDIVSWLGRLF